MSVTSTSSSYRIVPNQHDHVIGPPDPNTVTIDDDVINVDGVTLEGFNPANVSVTRTTTRKVTKITRSRSPSPARFSSEGRFTCNTYEESQPDYHNRHGYHVYTSETEEEDVSPPVTIYQGQPQVIRPKPKQAGPPVPPKRGTRPQQYTMGAISTPPNVKVRRYTDDLDPGSMSDTALIHVRGRPPLPSRGRPRRRKGRTAIYVQPACNVPSVKPTYSQDDTATVAFSPPPVPPHPESDSEEPPRVPPKPHMAKKNVPQYRNDELTSYHRPVLARRTSRGATMFYERQTRHSVDENDDVFEAPTVQYAQSPKMLVNNNQPITRQEAVMHPAPLTNHSHATMNGTHLSDEWPPPPPAYSQTEENSPISNVAVSPKPSSVQVPTPRKFSTSLKPALWSPAKTSSTASEPDEERTLKDMPAVWSPKGDVTKQFKPVRIDLSQPKKVKSPESQPLSPEEPVPVEKAHNTFTSPPPFVKPAPSVTSPAATVNRLPPTSDSPTPIILPEVPTLPIMPSKPVQNGIVHSPTSESSGPNIPTSPEAPLSPKQQIVIPVTSRPQHVPARRLSNPGVRNVQSSQQAVAKVALITDPSDQSKLELVQMHEVGGNVVHRDRNIHVAPQVQVITDKNKIPKGAVYQKQIIEGDVVHYDTYYPVKETTRTTRTVHTEKPEYSGIGPRDESGLPVGLRQHVKDENRSDWYKQMYKSIHKMDKPEECNPYNPTYSFPDDRKSEDEIVQTLDLFIPAGITCTSTTSANTTTNQHSSPDGGEVVMRRTTRTTPSARADSQKKSNVQVDARNTIDRYQQQPGSILNYVPGKSSLSEKERKHSEGQHFNPPPEETQPNFLSKSQTARKLYAPPPNAYTAPQQQTSPKPTSTPLASIDHGAYKQLLQGGYIPGKGLRKTSAEICQISRHSLNQEFLCHFLTELVANFQHNASNKSSNNTNTIEIHKRNKLKTCKQSVIGTSTFETSNLEQPIRKLLRFEDQNFSTNSLISKSASSTVMTTDAYSDLHESIQVWNAIREFDCAYFNDFSDYSREMKDCSDDCDIEISPIVASVAAEDIFPPCFSSSAFPSKTVPNFPNIGSKGTADKRLPPHCNSILMKSSKRKLAEKPLRCSWHKVSSRKQLGSLVPYGRLTSESELTKQNLSFVDKLEHCNMTEVYLASLDLNRCEESLEYSPSQEKIICYPVRPVFRKVQPLFGGAPPPEKPESIPRSNSHKTDFQDDVLLQMPQLANKIDHQDKVEEQISTKENNQSSSDSNETFKFGKEQTDDEPDNQLVIVDDSNGYAGHGDSSDTGLNSYSPTEEKKVRENRYRSRQRRNKKMAENTDKFSRSKSLNNLQSTRPTFIYKNYAAEVRDAGSGQTKQEHKSLIDFFNSKSGLCKRSKSLPGNSMIFPFDDDNTDGLSEVSFTSAKMSVIERDLSERTTSINNLKDTFQNKESKSLKKGPDDLGRPIGKIWDREDTVDYKPTRNSRQWLRELSEIERQRTRDTSKHDASMTVTKAVCAPVKKTLSNVNPMFGVHTMLYPDPLHFVRPEPRSHPNVKVNSDPRLSALSAAPPILNTPGNLKKSKEVEADNPFRNEFLECSSTDKDKIATVKDVDAIIGGYQLQREVTSVDKMPTDSVADLCQQKHADIDQLSDKKHKDDKLLPPEMETLSVPSRVKGKTKDITLSLGGLNLEIQLQEAGLSSDNESFASVFSEQNSATKYISNNEELVERSSMGALENVPDRCVGEIYPDHVSAKGRVAEDVSNHNYYSKKPLDKNPNKYIIEVTMEKYGRDNLDSNSERFTGYNGSGQGIKSRHPNDYTPERESKPIPKPRNLGVPKPLTSTHRNESFVSAMSSNSGSDSLSGQYQSKQLSNSNPNSYHLKNKDNKYSTVDDRFLNPGLQRSKVYDLRYLTQEELSIVPWVEDKVHSWHERNSRVPGTTSSTYPDILEFSNTESQFDSEISYNNTKAEPHVYMQKIKSVPLDFKRKHKAKHRSTQDKTLKREGRLNDTKDNTMSRHPHDRNGMSEVDQSSYSPGSYHSAGKELPTSTQEIQQPINSNIAKSPTTKLPKPRSLSSSSGGVSAAEQLNVVSAPPQRPPQELRGDVNANYKGTNARDKSSVERVIEEERQKRARQDYENQKSRRHSDNTAIKSPIITDERFGGSKQQHVRSPSQELKAHAIALYSFTAQSPKELSFNKGDTIILTRKIDNNWYEGEQYGRVGIFPVSYVEIITTLEEARTAQISSPTFEGKAKAKFRFTGESAMELGFKKGDYINLTKKVDNNWWEGRIGKKIGIFPAAYVDVIKEPQGNVQPRSPVARQTPSPERTSPYPSTSTPHRQASPHGQPIRMQQQQPQHQHQSYAQPLQNTRSPQSKFVPLASPTYKVNQGSGRGTSTVTKQPQETYRAIFAYTPQNEDELRLEEGDVILVMEKCEDGWYVGTSAKTGQFGTFPGNYVAKFYPD
ncbi:uncharacterized protein LOC117104671 [Anneissia japonica]|uniref:uncharacterized protein LOC117104671 n=1 Tax=Anneissia japonica TaxID=1529436 RepID=UPI0014258BE5|nr:uncharacterized protein LOC117104671 [Anneissia japonica]